MKGDIGKKSDFLKQMNNIFTKWAKDDLVTVPLMKTIEVLLQSDYLSDVKLVPDLLRIHSFCVAECNKSKSIVKLTAGIGVFANMLSYNDQDLCIKALRSLLFLLYNAFPKVRKQAAEKLYTSLLMLEDYSLLIPKGDEEAFDSAMAMLSETDWSLPLAVLSEQTKVQFYSFFG